MRTQYYEVTLEVHADLPLELVEQELRRRLDTMPYLDYSDLQIKRTGEDDPVVGEPEPEEVALP